jgi:hypothetical protein
VRGAGADALNAVGREFASPTSRRAGQLIRVDPGGILPGRAVPAALARGDEGVLIGALTEAGLDGAVHAVDAESAGRGADGGDQAEVDEGGDGGAADVAVVLDDAVDADDVARAGVQVEADGDPVGSAHLLVHGAVAHARVDVEGGDVH